MTVLLASSKGFEEPCVGFSHRFEVLSYDPQHQRLGSTSLIIIMIPPVSVLTIPSQHEDSGTEEEEISTGPTHHQHNSTGTRDLSRFGQCSSVGKCNHTESGSSSHWSNKRPPCCSSVRTLLMYRRVCYQGNRDYGLVGNMSGQAPLQSEI